MNDYFGDIVLILIIIILALIIVPVLLGMGIAYLIGATGHSYYLTIIIVSLLIWLCLYVLYYK